MSGSAENIGLRLTGDASGLKRALQEGGQAVGEYGKNAERDLKRAGDQAEKTGLQFKHIIGLLTAREVTQFGFRLLTGELNGFEQAMVSAETQAQKLRATLNFAVGKEGAARDMVFLRETTQALGLEFVSTAGQYARLAAASRGTNMEGRQTRELFEAIAQASTVMNMSAEESEGAFRAVQQMMSKGKVQAEELRGQLGERLPGAFQIAARSMNVTTGELDKMLERGEIMADDFLPKFAAQIKKELGGSVAEASNTAQAASNRFANSYTAFKQALADTGIYDAIASRQAKAAESFDTMAQSMRVAKEEGKGLFATLAGAFASDIGLRNPFSGISFNLKDNIEQLDEARQKLSALQAQTDHPGGTAYWLAQQREVVEYIRKLEEAIAKQKGLSAGPKNPADAYYDFPSRGQSVASEDRRLAANRASLDQLKQQLSGQNASYQKNLAEAYRLWTSGTIQTEKEYVDLVKKLIDEQGGIKKANAALPITGVLNSISEHTAQLRAEMDANKDLTSAQKEAVKVLEDLRTGHLKATEAQRAALGVALTGLLTLDKENTERERAIKLQAEVAKIIEKNTEAANKAAEAGIRALDNEIQTNERMREEIAMLGLDEGARTARLQLIEQETISRLELDLVMARNIEGNDAEISRLEREIELRKQRVGLIGKKGEAEEFQKQWESVDRTAHDVFTNIFEGGSNVFKKLGQVLKSSVLDLMYQLVVKKWVFNIFANVTGGGAAGAAGSAASSAGGSALGTVAGSMFGAGGLSGAIAGGAGWLTGATTFSGALSAGASLIGTGSAAGIMSGLGMMVGALGPIALGVAAIYSLLGSSGGGPKQEAGYSPAGMDIRGIDAGGSLQGAQRGDVSGAEQISKSIASSLDQAAKAFGVAINTAVGVFYAQDPEGTSQTQLQLVSQNYNRSNAMGGIENVARGDEALKSAIAESTADLILTELQKAVQGKAGEFLRTLDPLQLSAEEINAAVTAATNAQALWKTFDAMGPSMSVLSNLTVEATNKLIEAGGGLQQFTANLAGYYDNFYSAEEKRLNVATQISQQLAAAGGNVSPDQILGATRAQWRALVEETEAGSPLWSALIAVSGAFASITPEAQAAADAISSATQQMQNETANLRVQLLTAMGQAGAAATLQRQIDTAGMTAAQIAIYDYNAALRSQIAALNSATAAQQQLASQRYALETQLLQATGNTALLRERELAAMDASLQPMQRLLYQIEDEQAAAQRAATRRQTLISQYNSEASALQQTISKAREFTTTIRAFRDSLLVGQQSALTPAERYAEAQRQFAIAKDSGDSGALQTATQNLLAASEEMFGRSERYGQDFAMVQAALTQAANSQAAVADVAQLQLNAVNRQLTVLGRIDTNTAGLSAALQQAIAAMLAANGVVPSTENPAPTGTTATRPPTTTTQTTSTAPAAGAGALLTDSQVYDLMASLTAAGDNLGAYNVGKSSGRTMSYLDTLMHWPAMQIENWAIANKLPLYERGTNYLDRDGPIFAHRGERIMPAADNRALFQRLSDGQEGAQAMVAEIRTLISRIVELEKTVAHGAEANTRATIDNTKSITGAVRDVARRNSYAEQQRKVTAIV